MCSLSVFLETKSTLTPRKSVFKAINYLSAFPSDVPLALQIGYSGYIYVFVRYDRDCTCSVNKPRE